MIERHERAAPDRLLRDTVAVVLAGGQGTRLYPLTKHRAKPAVPFGGSYRIIDFTLSNCVNSGLRRILLLTQYKSFSLDRHLQQGWSILRHELGEFIIQLPPQQRMVRPWYEGTADAILQNIYNLEEQRPTYTVILSGDHVYLMDYAPMIEEHVANGADLTISSIEVSRDDARRFGVMQVDEKRRVIGFEEKPLEPKTIPDRETCLASMGVYVFSTDVLVRRVFDDAKNPASDHDFGKNIIPGMIDRDRVFAYPMPGREDRPPYWRDIGTLDSYWQTSMDLLCADPPIDIYRRSWPIRTYHEQRPPAHVERADGSSEPRITDSIVTHGVHVSSARIERSVLSGDVVVRPGAEVSESVLFSRVRVGEGAVIKRALIDKDVDIPTGEEIGVDIERDRRRFLVTEQGIVVVPRRFVFD